ncbi:M20 family metallo-hydrolase [Bacillaceae bacterium Marseille-Q3522]|nr:M20 family metallo-hydrolase [Bacillaceae bacterium Marseille-Q3522]
MAINVEAFIKKLASFGQSKNGGVHRLLYSRSWKEAQLAIKEQMELFGFTASFDRVGNLFGKIPGTDPGAKTILTGSHIDTVANGGLYDGLYGITASLLAAKTLYETKGRPKKTIEVVSLCEEEGSRFPLTFWGSGSITGKYTLTDGLPLKDSNGILLLDAMQEAGFNPDNGQSPVRDDLDCFVELHIEQGMILKSENKALGIVSHIVGQRRYSITISGESNHAGTTPMHLRKDALAGAALFISYIEKKAKECDPELVATVGKIDVKPNMPNVIAGDVMFTMDVRHYKETVLNQFYEELLHYFYTVSEEKNISFTVSNWMNIHPVAMDRKLIKLCEKIAAEKRLSFHSMISGAGHDAQVFGSYCPTVLLFVPSEKGISHSPEEYTCKEDLDNGISMLTELLYRLAY